MLCLPGVSLTALERALAAKGRRFSTPNIARAVNFLVSDMVNFLIDEHR